MASSPIFLLLLILSSTLLSVKSNTTTIESTCKTTNYYDLCVSALKSDPRSPTADTKGLAAIMASVGMTNATATASYIAKNLTATANNTVLKKVLKDCSDKYILAADSLRLTIQDLDDEAYDYAYMHVLAAQDYPNVCRNIFRRAKGLVYPAEISRCELTPFDLTKKKKKTFVVQDGIEDSAESHRRHTIRCLIVQEEGYIAEHPNDEKEVEGIDLPQQRYPWEGSDMDYLYDESSFAQLLSMELTLEIDGAIFHVPNANASSNVDSQL
uniref:Pectinesterase inhibitor domain-containing protein n=1 Tax=Brassica oleracea var. oleracea TaxID=109376 RepID=A0A0D3E270_BRAOL